MKSTRLATLCAALGLASFFNLNLQAAVYNDASNDLGNNGLANLDITSVEVTNDSVNLVIAVTTRSFATWTKYLIWIDTPAKANAAANSNGWGRPASMATGEGADFFVGSWVDATPGNAQLWEFTSAWNEHSTSPLTNLIAGNTVTFTIPLSTLGLSTGNVIKFDVATSSGGGTDPGIDHASKQTQSNTGTGDAVWASPSTGGPMLSYTVAALADSDNDGLPDSWENTYFGNLSQTASGDPDNDGLTNAQEFASGTNPNNADTDNDGLNDGVETKTGIFVSSSNTGTDPLVADTDGDGFRDGVETNTGTFVSATNTGTSPLVADQRVFLVGDNALFPGGEWQVDNTNNLLFPTSGGAYTNAKSVTKPIANPGFMEFKFTAGNWDVNWGVGTNTVITVNTNTGLVSGTLIQDKLPTTNDVTANIKIHLARGEHTFTFNNATNSFLFSVARNTYTNYAAYVAAYGLIGYDADPTEDPDNDTLTNQQEFAANTAPNLADTDGDGLSDAEELAGSNGFVTNPLLFDSDADGLPDLWEMQNGLNPISALGDDGANGDPDGDGLTNAQELANNTNPKGANTGFSSPYSRVTLFGDFNAWDQAGTWRNNMRLYANNSWEAMLYVASTNLPATNGFKFLTVQNGTNGFWGRAATPDVAVKGAYENLLNTTMVTGTNYYRFTFNDFTGAYTLTRINPDDDNDGDLLPDAWEQYYGKYANPPLTNSPWLSVSTNYNNTADLSDNGTRTNLTTGQKYQRGFNPVQDVEPPVIVWNEPLTVFVEAGSDYADAATATDNNLTLPTLVHSLTNVPAGAPDGVLTNVVTATDAASNSVTGNRKLVVGGLLGGYGKGATFYNLQYPRLATNATSAGSFDAYAQVWVDGVTGGTNVDTRIRGWIGVATTDADPTTSPEAFVWTAASLNAGNTGPNDEYKVTFTNLAVGTNYVASRWQVGTNPASAYFYGGINEDGQGGRWGLQTTADVGGVTVPRTYANGRIVVQGLPTITWANLQFPLAETNTVGTSFDVYGRFFAQDVTEPAGAPTYGTVVAQVGYNSSNTDPASWPSLSWSPAGWVSQDGNNDEFKATLSGLAAGTYYTATRFSLDGGTTWVYGGTNGVWNNDSGTITVSPAAPSGSSFSGWLGSSPASAELVKQYAFGAATPGSAVNRSNLPSGGVSGGNLTLTYFVRGEATNPNLVLPQVHTNLVESNAWAAVAGSNITTLGTNTVDGVEVIQKRAAVPVDGTRKFLRLIIAE